ncbi:MAG: hypothetical protein IT190_02075 [Microbacteriaceae bacterium]|nr:hypothetical protein [Microbacteriaceae bacterium]
MSDDLAVGGPASTSVLTTELVEECSRLSRLGWEMEGCLRELMAIDRVVGNGILNAADAPLSALRAEQAIDEATAGLGVAVQECALLTRGLSMAVQQYEWVDRHVAVLEEHLAAKMAYLLGAIAPALIAVMLPGALLAAAGVAAFLATLPEKTRAALFTSIGSWLRANSGALTDPRVVSAVRLSVMSADDAGMGLAHLPPNIAAALGDEGLGILGVDTSAAVLAGAASGLGLLRESPVRVTQGATEDGVSNAVTIRDRVERIPTDLAQVRIDRYSVPGQPDRFEVYIAGTADLSATNGNEPWDMASNVTATAGGSDGSGAGSYRSVTEAMELAGIGADSPVTVTGYSQGGLIAAQLAASGDYAIVGLITVAAPAGQVAVPHDIPYLAIEHTDDLIPALGGRFVSSDPLVVQREVFDGPPPTAQFVLPAHQLTHYLDTAGLIDDSENLRLRGVLQQFSHPQAENVTSTVFLAERVGN